MDRFGNQRRGGGDNTAAPGRGSVTKGTTCCSSQEDDDLYNFDSVQEIPAKYRSLFSRHDESECSTSLHTSTNVSRVPTPWPISGSTESLRPDTPLITRRVSTSLNPRFASKPPNITRPRSSISAAGYRPSSAKTAYKRPGATVSSTGDFVSLNPEETPKMCVEKMEIEIRKLCDECDDLLDENPIECLEIAKAAEEKEKALVRYEEDEGIFNFHDWDITFEALMTLAKAHAACEQFDQAFKTYDLIKSERFATRLHVIETQIGDIYMKQNKFRAAIKAYRFALDRVGKAYRSKRRNLLSKTGIAFMKLNKPDEASACFANIMAECPDIRSAFHYCMTSCCLEDYVAAKTSFIIMVNSPPYVGEYETWTLGPGPLSDEQKEALELVFSNDPLAKYYKEKQDYANKCVLTAARILAPSMYGTPNKGYNWVLKTLKKSKYDSLIPGIEVSKSVCLINEKKYSDAITLLKKVAEGRNTVFSSLANTNLCFLLRLQSNHVEAMEFGKAAILGNYGDCYSAVAYLNVGCCRLEEKDFAHAIECFKEALCLDSANIEVLYNLGLANRLAKNYNQALMYFYKVLKIVPTYADTYYQIALALQLKKDYTRASEWYNRALGFSPNDPIILLHLGELAEIEGNLKEAYHCYSDSYKADPTQLKTVKWLLKYVGHVLHRPNEAQQYCIQGFKLKSDDPFWLITLALAYKGIGEYPRAINLLRKAHADYPENMEVLEELISMRRALTEEEYFYCEVQLGKLAALKKVEREESSVESSDVDSFTSSLLLSKRGATSSLSQTVESYTTSSSSMESVPSSTSVSRLSNEIFEEIEANELDQFFETVDVTNLLPK